MTCVKFFTVNCDTSSQLVNDMECEFFVQVLKVPEDVFNSNKFRGDWMKIIIVYIHNWKQLCE